MNRRNMMFGSFSGMVLSVVVGALPLFAKECVWDANGSGGWADDTRWVDGVKPTANGDTVLIAGENVTATVRDTDVAVFQLVSKVTIESAGSQLVVDMSAGTPVDVPAVFDGSGRLVKTGSATMNLTTAGDDFRTLLGNLTGGLVVSNGTVQLPNRDAQLELTRVEVFGDGVLSLGNAANQSITRGIWGDGTVRNDNSNCQVYLYAPDTNPNRPTFSGHFEGKVEITPYYYSSSGAGVQYLTGTTDINLVLRLFGVLGAKTLGSKDGASSLGTGSIGFRNNYSCLRLLNEADEESDKNLQFQGDAGLARIDAGARGGVRFTGAWNLPAYTSFGPNYKYNTIILTGSNATANVVAATDMYDMDTRSTAYWRKEGTGVWRFAHADRAINGTMEVRRGTLEFESLAEKGVGCSLGKATRTGPDVGHKVAAERMGDAVPRVPYAYRLGNAEYEPLVPDDDYLPTMQYVGADNVVCTTRPFVIDGVGRILSSGGALTLAGASAYTNGTHTLVLDGSAAVTNQFASVTNGPLGTLNVVKRGAGLWKLADDIDIGAVRAEQGTLRVGSSYSFYRWTITANNQGEGGKWIASFNGFALMDKDGNMVNGMVGAKDVMETGKFAHPEQLLPGELCYGRSNYGSTGSRYPAKSFHWNPEIEKFAGASAAIDVTVQKADESTHPIVYFRVDEGVEVAKYDILADGGNATSRERAVAQWELAGSVDGKTWDVLHTVDDSNMPVMPMDANTWYSDKQPGVTPSKGFDIPTGSTNATLNVASVSAAPGATLEFIGNAAGKTVDKIVLDAVNGGGAIKGAAFAATGTLVLENWSSDRCDIKLPLDLGACTGFANIANWTVVAGDKVLRNTIRVEADGITVDRNGLLIFVR